MSRAQHCEVLSVGPTARAKIRRGVLSYPVSSTVLAYSQRQDAPPLKNSHQTAMKGHLKCGVRLSLASRSPIPSVSVIGRCRLVVVGGVGSVVLASCCSTMSTAMHAPIKAGHSHQPLYEAISCHPVP